ncbi:cupin [Beijerinckia indica]|uniref:Cupin 2 conserved barrel domain protein n=1 Tax=Beijerinckia indica subsp. indica (strain ATCC 9039 / DSM 1715 / NCIMB 8712) TaxID=395963 RepID=B2IJS3_BEII9|nr:cupin [Beijerinckia indica]ACB94945.1 conserved hypothetical protein [Beijerinckia indica subsp. indica ATCC 9039]
MRHCIVILLSLLPPLPLLAAEELERPVFHYWHNWTDATGVTHMTRCPLTEFTLKSMSPPAGPQWQDRQPIGTAQVLTTVQPAGWNGTWHEDPKVQWIIPLRGTWFVQAMDGTRVELGPGDISLGEDQNSTGKQGHLAGNVSEESVTLMVIQLDVTPTIGQPCHFK